MNKEQVMTKFNNMINAKVNQNSIKEVLSLDDFAKYGFQDEEVRYIQDVLKHDDIILLEDAQNKLKDEENSMNANEVQAALSNMHDAKDNNFIDTSSQEYGIVTSNLIQQFILN